jgi:hypothetical protein
MCITRGLRVLEHFAQPLQKMIPVPVTTENLHPFYAPDHDVVHSAGSIDSRFEIALA